MSPISIENGMLRVDGRPLPFVAGEIQFWRMHPDSWRKAIETARDSGFTVISSYLSWRRHEPRRGELDFDGTTDPRLDVRRFVRLCADAGVLVQLKPGPWICAEEPGGGLPDWIMLRTDLLARDDQGDVVVGYNPPFQHPTPSYSNPAYLTAVRRWIADVWNALGEYVHPRGAIAMVQLDNEPSLAFQDSMYGSDRSEAAVVAFRSWLERRYGGDADAVRSAWDESGLQGFSRAQPPRRPAPGELPATDRKLYDWIEFTTWATADYLAQLSTMHESSGGGALLRTVNLVTHPVHDVPVSHSSIRGAVDAAVGEDHYYIPPLDTADIHRLARSAATARAAGEPLPWIPELQAGIWRSPGEHVEYPDPTPLEQEIWWGAAIALGFKGFNLYMLADRENWEFSPINSAATRSPFFRPIEKLSASLAKSMETLTASPLPDLVIAWHRPDAWDAYAVMGTSRVPDVAGADPVRAEAYKAWDETLETLTALGVTYDLWDTATEPVVDGRAIVVPPLSGIDPDAIAALRDAGRTIVQLVERDPELIASALSGTLDGLPSARSDGGRLGRALVSVRESNSESIAHIVFWGGDAVDATIELPGWPDGVASFAATGARTKISKGRAHLTLTPGHHVLVMSRTSSVRPATVPESREEQPAVRL